MCPAVLYCLGSTYVAQAYPLRATRGDFVIVTETSHYPGPFAFTMATHVEDEVLGTHGRTGVDLNCAAE